MTDKIILADADGVLLDWESEFSNWMADREYHINISNHKLTYDLAARYGIDKEQLMDQVGQFNCSKHIRHLKPHRDSVKYVTKLHNEHGYKFHVITSMSDNELAGQRRIENMQEVFGDVFEKFVFLDTGAAKDDVLEPYRNTGYWWIEDKPENAQVGVNIGLRAIIMEHGFNMQSSVAPRIKSWEEFYNNYINI